MNSSLYEQLGGEEGLRKLVRDFYQIMDRLPETQAIRKMHPPDLAGSEEKLFMFLSGWLGGPALFVERFGHPRLRMRHFPFSIGAAERDQWMLCMVGALQQTGLPDATQNQLIQALYRLADHMRNQPE